MAARRLLLFVALVACLAVAGPAWAGSLQFHGNDFPVGQGALSFTPGIGNDLTIGPGGGVQGALVTDFFSQTQCGGDCQIIGGYMTLATGGETGGSAGGGAFNYTFGAGGNIEIFGKIPLLGINSSTLLFSASFVGGSFSGSSTVGSIIASINLASIVLNPALGIYHYSGTNNNDISFSISSSCG